MYLKKIVKVVYAYFTMANFFFLQCTIKSHFKGTKLSWHQNKQETQWPRTAKWGSCSIRLEKYSVSCQHCKRFISHHVCWRALLSLTYLVNTRPDAIYWPAEHMLTTVIFLKRLQKNFFLPLAYFRPHNWTGCFSAVWATLKTHRKVLLKNHKRDEVWSVKAYYQSENEMLKCEKSELTKIIILLYGNKTNNILTLLLLLHVIICD